MFGWFYDENAWDKGYAYKDLASKISIKDASDLTKILKSAPRLAVYKGSEGKHAVVITGIVAAPEHEILVMTNNPWGQKNIQTYADFRNGIPDDETGMKFDAVYELLI